MANKIIRLTEEDLCDIIKKTTIKLLENKQLNQNENGYEQRLYSILRNLPKEEIQKVWIDYRDIHKAASYSNPVTIAMMSHVNEGLIHTYPIEKTIEYIKSYFDLKDWQIEKKQADNGLYHIWVAIHTFGDNIELIKKAMSSCGYYLGHPKENGIPKNRIVWLQFEAKIQDDESKKVRSEEKTLLHLTPTYNLGKIKNIGFSPRCKNSLFNYPSRVYFLRGSISKEEAIDICRQLSEKNTSLGNTGEYVLFTVDLAKIPKNVELCLDPNYPHGVYTSSNISPKTIIGYEKINI